MDPPAAVRAARLLRELFALRVDDHGVVQIGRCGQPQLLLQPDLPRRRGEQIRAADDVGDRLVGVVDDHRKLVREQPVGALDHEVADVAVEPLLLAPCRRSTK